MEIARIGSIRGFKLATKGEKKTAFALPAFGVAVICLGLPTGCWATNASLEPISETMSDLQSVLAVEKAALGTALIVPTWLGDGTRFLYSEWPGSLSVFLTDPRTKQVSQLTRDAQVRSSLTAITGRANNEISAQIDGLSRDGKLLYLRIENNFFAFDIGDHSLRIAPERALEVRNSRPRLVSNQFPTTFGDLTETRSPDGKSFVTIENHNLFLRSPPADTLRPLTNDGSPNLSWQATEESAQTSTIFWSPDSSRIAAVQLDTREVWHEPLVHWLEAHPRAEQTVFPRAGESMQRFRLVLIDAVSGAKTPIDTGDTADHYVNLLGWRADGKAVFYQAFDREQRQVTFFSADAASGASKPLLSERSATYVDTRMTLGMDFFRPLRNSNGFLLLSDRDGWRHLYRYDAEGRLGARLTQGEWPIEELVAIDEESGWIYFRASQDAQRPYDLQLFRVSLEGGKPQQLTAGGGAHTIIMSPSNQFFLATRAGPSLPPVTELHACDGRLIKILGRAGIKPLVRTGFGGAEEFSALTADGTSVMHGMIVRPYHFDASRRYPLVELIYGGMQSINVSHDSFAATGMGSAPIVAALTSAGIGVAVVDAPGTPGRGKRFQDATYGTWPGGVIVNHVHWLEAAGKANPWIDLARVGIYGHSWGGYLAETAMADAPAFYKVAVAHAAPADLVDHSTYIEPFLGLPSHNPLAYEKGSVLHRVNSIEGPILIMSAPLDANAAFSPGMKLADALINAKKDFDLFVAPSNNHRMTCCGEEQALYQVAFVQRYFRQHLLGLAATTRASQEP
jgi:dipeptidyl-peptidase-4